MHNEKKVEWVLRVAVGLATATRPRFRCLRVQEAAVLDKIRLHDLCDAAEAAGYQILLETIDPEGADLVIEDGAVKATEATEPASTPPQPCR